MRVRRHVLAALVLSAVVAASPVRADDQPGDKPGAENAPKSAAKDKPAAKDADSKPEGKSPGKSEEKLALHRGPAPTTMRQAMARLDRIKVSVDFDELEFDRVVRFIANVAGFDVIIGAALQGPGADELSPITLKLRDVSLRRLAELVAQFSKTSLYFGKGILEFTTKEAARGKPVMRIYQISEITQPLRNFPGPDINLRASGVDFEDEKESDVESSFGDADSVKDLIQRMVEPETWEDDKTSIAAYSGKLVVKTYPEIHRKIARFLNALRANR